MVNLMRATSAAVERRPAWRPREGGVDYFMSYAEIWKFIKPYKYLIVETVASLIIFTNLGLVMPWILKLIIDRALGSSDLGYLFLLLGVIAMVYAVREVFFYISHYLAFYVAQRILFDVRSRLFKHIQSLSLRFYQEYRTGKLISNILTDVSTLQQMISASMVNLVVNIFMIAFILSVLFLINTKLALICLFLAPLHFINFNYFKNTITKDSKILREKMSEISANLAETLNGVKIVKSFSKERAESREFVAQLRPTFDMTININMKGVYCWIVAEVIGVVYLVVALGLGGAMVARGEMTIGSFVAFYSYLGMLTGPINAISGLSTIISEGYTSGARIFRLLTTVPEITEDDEPIRIERARGEVQFDNICFGYNGKPILKNFSLKVEPGRKVALVGPSGSGKSTIASLLLRFYDVNSGSVKLDGTDIRSYTLASYRNNVGIVLQDSFLFSGTIEDNIRYGKEDATKEEVIEAAKKANAHEFIMSLENQYKSEVGENGVTLSGGQKQRIAIARTILRNPSVLVLDEATSALDSVSEAAVQEALDNLMQDKTTIIIAHRLSTVRNADQIVVLKDGRVSQIGRHGDLMRKDGIYRDLYTLQRRADDEGEPEPLPLAA